MKTELKTARAHLSKYATETQLDNNSIPITNAISAIESHTSERLDHLRQQLEEEEKECITPTYCNGIRKAISLIDQLKAETKNT